jgi:hypothetical protein
MRSNSYACKCTIRPNMSSTKGLLPLNKRLGLNCSLRVHSFALCRNSNFFCRTSSVLCVAHSSARCSGESSRFSVVSGVPRVAGCSFTVLRRPFAWSLTVVWPTVTWQCASSFAGLSDGRGGGRGGKRGSTRLHADSDGGTGERCSRRAVLGLRRDWRDVTSGSSRIQIQPL